MHVHHKTHSTKSLALKDVLSGFFMPQKDVAREIEALEHVEHDEANIHVGDGVQDYLSTTGGIVNSIDLKL